MIGFRLVNLLIPGEPQTLQIHTPSGKWELKKAHVYAESVKAIQNGQCGITYSIEHPVSLGADGAAACDVAIDEMAPLLLGSSYLSGLSVTADRSLPHSDVSILQRGSHWPRERAMGSGRSAVSTQAEFATVLQTLVGAWPVAGQKQKMLLLLHHWLDALACWSLEDLYLSATTLLQIISATEEDAQGKELSYFDGVTGASNRVGIPSLGRDFKDMRNNLIHEGKLLGGRFAGNGITDCASVAADVLNWFDDYVYAVLALGAARRRRFTSAEFTSLNAYSIPWP
jgi:hypothetical protein